VVVVRLPHASDLPVPGYQTDGAAGADLHAAIDAPVELRMGEVARIPTGLMLAIPEGYEGQVRPRSGWAFKHGVTLVNAPGTIDADFRGEIQVLLTCLKSEPCTVRRGDRIAQIVFAPVVRARFEETTSLEASARGTGGFGHTGKAEGRHPASTPATGT
jgi:dUTP pyrophosphatase